MQSHDRTNLQCLPVNRVEANLKYKRQIKYQDPRTIYTRPRIISYKFKPSGSPSLIVFKTRSLATLKSSILTLILRSRRASKLALE
jgi:hypothetical protein